MRIVPRSLHGRLLALSLIATLVALAVAGAAIAGVLGRFVTQGLDQRLDAELALLASTVNGDGRVDRTRLTRVRGLLDGGPGWQWRIVAPDGTLGSADMPAFDPGRGPLGPDGKGPQPGGGRPHPGDGRDARGEALHSRETTIDTPRGSVTIAAAAPREIVARPIRAALLPLLATMAILGLALGAASVVQLRLGLRPLRRLQGGVAAIRSGTTTTLDEDQPDELRPLVAELNALVRDNAAALTTARASAANLAHALKTPIATLALELRDDPARAAQVDRVYRTIRHHLARVRGVADPRVATLLAPAVADLVATIRRLHADRDVAIEAVIDPMLAVAIESADLEELLGNLIDNAVRHAAARVAIDAHAMSRTVRLTIVDDGPGIPAADRERAVRPGVRLDERGDGDGFGLAIARELAALHGGRLILDEPPSGGLAASVDLPIATARV